MSQQFVEAPDGTRVAFSVRGSGPALVLTNGLTTTSWFWQYLAPRWAEGHTVITWELPGHGSSEPARSRTSASIEGQPAIIVRIMDELGIRSATHVGFSVGCQVVLELARQAPDRCDALVALFGSYEHALRSTALPVPGALLHRMLHDRGGPAFASFVFRLAQLARAPGGLALVRGLHIVGRQAREEDLKRMMRNMLRLHPATCAALACSAEEHSAAPGLAHLRMPLLIMAGDRDRFAPPRRVGEPLHRAVPHSVFVRLTTATHTALFDHAEQIDESVSSFLGSAQRK